MLAVFHVFWFFCVLWLVLGWIFWKMMKVFCETKWLIMTILCAICFGTTNTNTQNDTNFCNFFQVFWKFLSLFYFCYFPSFSGQEMPFFGFLIEHCIDSRNSGLVFNIIISRNLNFLDKTCYFSENFCHFFMFPRFSGQEITFLVF